MRANPPDKNSSNQIVVEGPDDQGVVIALLDPLKIVPRVFVKQAEGYENLRETLEVLLQPGGVARRIGIVVDADSDPASRWRSLRDRLIGSGYLEVPEEPDPAGTIIEDVIRPRVGIWLMPDNVSAGMLEDFMTRLTPPGDSLLDRAEQAVEAIPPDARKFRPVQHRKAVLHTWLAWQQEPGRPMGQAIKRNDFLTQGPQVDEFLAWLTRLFG